MLPTCKEVSTAFARGEYSGVSLGTKLRVQLHLALCWHCRRFRLQLALIDQTLRTLVFPASSPAADAALQQAVLKRLRTL